MWHIVFSFYNSQNYSAFYYEEVTAFELSTSKVKTAVSTNWLDFRQKLFPQSLRGGFNGFYGKKVIVGGLNGFYGKRVIVGGFNGFNGNGLIVGGFNGFCGKI